MHVLVCAHNSHITHSLAIASDYPVPYRYSLNRIINNHKYTLFIYLLLLSLLIVYLFVCKLFIQLFYITSLFTRPVI